MTNINGLVVLVTGGSGALSASTAFHLAKLSAKVAIVGLNEEDLRKVAMQCEQTTGLRPLIIIANIQIEHDVLRTVKETIDHYGRLDILVNNAGSVQRGGIKSSSVRLFEKVMMENTKSVFCMTQHCLAYLMETRGCIVNIPPYAPASNTPAVAYNMSKVALNNFTRCIAMELAEDEVTVNTINPTFVKPPEVCDQEYKMMFVAGFSDTIPQQMIKKGEEIAALISFLTTDKGRCITGASFVLGGTNTYRKIQ